MFHVSPNPGREESETQVLQRSGRVVPAQAELLRGAVGPSGDPAGVPAGQAGAEPTEGPCSP